MTVNYLTRENERDLIYRVTNNSNGEGYKAKQELFHMCEYLVSSVVSKYSNPYVSAEKLFEIGKGQLEKALRLYLENERKTQFKFSTYSVYFIKEAIEKEIAKGREK